MISRSVLRQAVGTGFSWSSFSAGTSVSFSAGTSVSKDTEVPALNDTEVPALKDDQENPVPTAWRSTLREIIRAFAYGDYELKRGIPCVEPVTAKGVRQVRTY